MFWSTIGTAMKMSLRYIDFMNLLFWSVVTAVILHGIAVWSRGLLKKVVPPTAKEWRLTLFTGFLNPFLYYIVLLRAYDLLPAQEAGTLNYFWPVMLVLLSIPVLGQKPGLGGIAGILLGFAGLVVISTHGDPFSMQFSNGFGVLLAVGSALIWAVYWLAGMKDTRRDEVKLFSGFVTALILLTVTMLITGTFRVPSLYGLLGGVYLGIFEMGITFLLWMKALHLAPDTARVSNLVFLSPFISLIFIHFIVGEPILTSTFVGLTLVVSGIFVQQLGRRKAASFRA
ncbi:MAG TPA: EamA family transporter [Bacteroidales bacterium]|nr:MAG: hypothetical protein A2X11_09845 [Bacteroidetes bacterium GWE2_42_24]OFY26202.1 MAG: hypothetical protein A2X09_05295 [Bacteroidetes bacterium GWF2_43_11]PKP19061.1 MAG: EamA family transporter [Bacteroidetes bacterium HGW-Bacteroidetes-22]HBZ67522.1 EamA family transporter [Bacteroidales bacterium]